MTPRSGGMARALRALAWATFAALACGCELIAGLPSVTDGRDAGTGGGAGQCATAPPGACPDGGCAPERLFETETPSGITVHGTTVFWAEEGKVVSASLETKEILDSWNANTASHLAADESGIYWGEVNLNCIGFAPHDGGPPGDRKLGGCQGLFGGRLALDATFVYWTVDNQDGSPCTEGPACCGPSDTGCVMRARKDGTGEPTFYAQAQLDARALALRGPHLYWGSSGAIRRCPREGCAGMPEVVVADAGIVNGMAFDGEVLYWLDALRGEVRRKDLGDEGSVVEIVDDENNYGRGLAVDDGHVYWSDLHSVWRKKTSSLKEPREQLGGDAAWSIAVDCGHVYWTERGEEPGVWRVAR